MQLVDYIPLAVTLLAHLAESESPSALYARWDAEQTELIRARGPKHRLSNLDFSIELSLHSSRLQDDPTAIHALSVICALPQGLWEPRTTLFVDTFSTSIPTFRACVTLLKQCSLVHSTEDGFHRTLSPVRHYMQTHYPVTDLFVDHLFDIYLDFKCSSYAGFEFDHVEPTQRSREAFSSGRHIHNWR